jgi:RNA-binding protein
LRPRPLTWAFGISGPAHGVASDAGFSYNAPVLTGKQRHHLRGLGHELKAVVMVGKDGIDDGVIAAIEVALNDHELIKVRIGEGADLDRAEAAQELAEKSKSEVAQVLGNTLLLYRMHPTASKIVFPE